MERAILEEYDGCNALVNLPRLVDQSRPENRFTPSKQHAHRALAVGMAKKIPTDP